MLICGFYFLKIEYFYVFCKYWVNLQFFSVYIQKSYFALNKFVLIFFFWGGGCGNNDLKLKKKKSLPKTQDKKVQYYEIQYFENY